MIKKLIVTNSMSVFIFFNFMCFSYGPTKQQVKASSKHLINLNLQTENIGFGIMDETQRNTPPITLA